MSRRGGFDQANVKGKQEAELVPQKCDLLPHDAT